MKELLVFHLLVFVFNAGELVALCKKNFYLELGFMGT